MVTLPYRNETRPLFRILTKASWANGTGSWTVEPSYDRFSNNKPAAFGFEVLYLSRVCLPHVGEARIRFRYGLIDGRIVAPSEATVKRSQSGSAWDPASDSVTVPDLRRKEIRIQAAPRVTTGTPAWRTVWWGQCEFMTDADAGGASIPMGDRTYHCVDGLFRTKRWPLNRYSFYYSPDGATDTVTIANALGEPSFNVTSETGAVLGNKLDASWTYDPSSPEGYESGGDNDATGLAGSFTWPGAGTTWTDLETINTAFKIARPRGEPVFTLSGTTSLYSTGKGNAWRARESEDVWSFIGRIFRRERGLGVAFVDWDDDSGNPTGPLAVSVRSYPQALDDVSSFDPTQGSSVVTTIPGATTAHTTDEVELIGDHRLSEGSFSLGDREVTRYDRVESLGEQIQVLVTLSRYDSRDVKVSLENRWTDKHATVYESLSWQSRVDESWRPVYQLYGLPRSWSGLAADHNDGTKVARHRVDYRCADNGDVMIFSDTASALHADKGHADTLPMEVEVMPDLPLIEGYTYAGNTPARKDGTAETGMPQRRPPMVLLRMADDKYIIGEFAIKPIGISVHKDGIFMAHPGDVDAVGSRRTVAKTGGNLGSFYNNNQIGCTVGLRMPHRVRMATTGVDADGNTLTEDKIRRRLRLDHDNLHLWLASPGAIWDLDTQNKTINIPTGVPVKRNACNGTQDKPGVLRDDRGSLGRRHALACEWYLKERRTATWALKACGLLKEFQTADGNGDPADFINYPTLGYTVTTLNAAGQGSTINTPITSVVYDNESCVTTWATDWAELDFKK